MTVSTVQCVHFYLTSREAVPRVATLTEPVDGYPQLLRELSRPVARSAVTGSRAAQLRIQLLDQVGRHRDLVLVDAWRHGGLEQAHPAVRAPEFGGEIGLGSPAAALARLQHPRADHARLALRGSRDRSRGKRFLKPRPELAGQAGAPIGGVGSEPALSRLPPFRRQAIANRRPA
jgi:hypothetical protein